MSLPVLVSVVKNGLTPIGTAKTVFQTLFKPTQSSSCDGVVNGQMCCFDANEAMKQNAPHCRSASSVFNNLSNVNTTTTPTLPNQMQITRPYFTSSMDPLQPFNNLPTLNSSHSVATPSTFTNGNTSGVVFGELPSYTLVTKTKPAAGWGIITPPIGCAPNCIQPKEKTDYVVYNYPSFLEQNRSGFLEQNRAGFLEQNRHGFLNQFSTSKF